MKNTDKINKDLKESSDELESAGRRKAVKTIVGGVTAVAAFNLLPAKWGTPIIEQVFLPAHAQTSGDGYVDPSIPVTEGHPYHPDYPHHPSSPSHPHNNPSAVIGQITIQTFAGAGYSAISVKPEITFNRIAQYTIIVTNTSLVGISETRAYISSTVPSTAGPNFTMNGSPGDLIEVTVSNNVNSEVVTQTATVPDFTVTSGSTGIVLLTTYPSTSNSGVDRTIGTIDLSNGATEPVNHVYNTDVSAGGLMTTRNYSPGRYTLSWSNSGSTASEATLSVGGASNSVTFDPRNNSSWTLEVT